MNIEIIATIGPSSLHKNVLSSYKQRCVNFIRVNLSHTRIEDLEKVIVQMKESGIEVIIDTEGSQIRTGYLGAKSVSFSEGDVIKIYDAPIHCSAKKIYLRPTEVLSSLEIGSLISVDFNSVLLKVTDIKTRERRHYISAVVVIGGIVGNNKAVTVDSITHLPPFSDKDIQAIKIAKKHKITCFTLSFMDSKDEVRIFKTLYPQAKLISKIETKQGIMHFDEILEESDGILIDRGDLSREIPGERIPFAQKIIIKKCNKANKPVYVATNILESMSESLKPMKSEINDVVNTILDGVNGLVLTKESAVGKYPIETVNMLKTIIQHTLSSLHYLNEKSLRYVTEHPFMEALVEPHGGTLINRFQVMAFSELELRAMPHIMVDDEILMDAEQIAIGGFSPLEGFMNSTELKSVLETMRLPSGLPWTMPIIFPCTKEDVKRIKEKQHIALKRKKDRQIYATLLIDEIYTIDKANICKQWFGTDNQEHPGVRGIFMCGDHYIGGKINMLRRIPSEFKNYEITPLQARKIFQEKGWSVVVGFHTRNAIHRSHEYIQLHAMEKVSADGIFVHPIVGKKKKGDFEARIIIKSYELMMQKFYPKGKVVMGVYATFSRYAGPREAIFTAICRKNYGCSHFIVGRDHTGVGDFYKPMASHEIFKKFPDLGIIPIFFNKVYYSKIQKKHVMENDDVQRNIIEREDQKIQISGTQLRKMLGEKSVPPLWFMRREIASLIITEIKKGNKVFV